jgi:hypothetical protein
MGSRNQPSTIQGTTMSNNQDSFVSIDEEKLETVSGGAARVASGGGSSSANDQLLTMLTSIGESIKDLGRNNNGGDQMMQMMMMMMMMGGMGGGGVVAAPPAAVAQPTYIQVSAQGGRCGKKGW